MSSVVLSSLSPIPEELVKVIKCEHITGGDLSVCEESEGGEGSVCEESEGGEGAVCEESEVGEGAVCEESEGGEGSVCEESEGGEGSVCECSDEDSYLVCDSPDSESDNEGTTGSSLPSTPDEVSDAEVPSIFNNLKVQLENFLPKAKDPIIKAKLPAQDLYLCSPYNISDSDSPSSSPSSSPFSTPPGSPRSTSPCSIIRASNALHKEVTLEKNTSVTEGCYLRPDTPLEVQFDRLDGPLKVKIDECAYTKNEVVLKHHNIDTSKSFNVKFDSPDAAKPTNILISEELADTKLNFDINAPTNNAPLNVHILDDRKKALQEHLVVNIDRPFASDQPLKVHIEESMIPLYGSMDVLIKYNDKNIMVQLDADLLAKLQISGPVKVNI